MTKQERIDNALRVLLARARLLPLSRGDQLMRELIELRRRRRGAELPAVRMVAMLLRRYQ